MTVSYELCPSRLVVSRQNDGKMHVVAFEDLRDWGDTPWWTVADIWIGPARGWRRAADRLRKKFGIDFKDVEFTYDEFSKFDIVKILLACDNDGNVFELQIDDHTLSVRHQETEFLYIMYHGERFRRVQRAFQRHLAKKSAS
jgi:hypothetical protein